MPSQVTSYYHFDFWWTTNIEDSFSSSSLPKWHYLRNHLPWLEYPRNESGSINSALHEFTKQTWHCHENITILFSKHKENDQQKLGKVEKKRMS